ncbi:MAG: methionyl-tRNA formyltransferase [Candidatus Zhuqueibacterota bacterium]
MKRDSKFKILFFGSNLLGCTVLRNLLRSKNIKIVLVVGSYHDNGSVVEPRVWNASIARLSINKMLPFIQPKSTRNLQFINDLQRLEQPDLIITVEYDKILDPQILAIPKLGAINIHFSSLPKNRGSLPVVWSILEGDKAGVTLHWLNHEINGGDIIAEKSIPILDDDTSFSIYSKLTKFGMDLFKSTFPKILKGSAPRIPQEEALATYHPDGYPEQRIIDWTKSGFAIDRFIRAMTFPGFEPARTFINEMEISVLHPVDILQSRANDARRAPGTILEISPEGLVIQTGRGGLRINKIQINQSMPIDAYKLGKLFTLKTGDRFMSYEKIAVESKLNLIVP